MPKNHHRNSYTAYHDHKTKTYSHFHPRAAKVSPFQLRRTK